MDSIKRKLSKYRALKTISYLVGFPLLLVMVFATTVSFLGKGIYGFGAWYGILVIVGLWLVVTILQIVVSSFSKCYKARTMIMLIIAVGLVLTGAIVMDAVGTKMIKDVQEEYKEQNVKIEDYTYQVNWFVTVTSNKKSMNDKFLTNVDDFLRVYNVRLSSKNYGGDKNTDLSKVTYNKDDDAYYSPNGMYSDGFIFNINQAIDILITYHEAQASYKAKNKNVDTELEAAIAALESNSSSAWNQYKQTDEYKAAYGVDGDAYKYMLTEERLNLILKSLGMELQGYTDALSAVLNLFGMNEYASLLSYINSNLTVDQIVTIVNDMNLFDEDIIKADLMELLKGFSFYQSPQARPIFDFIEDEELREYAFAKYYATVHGSKVGSVLIGDNIGQVTMDASGFPASYGYSLDELYQLKADLSYKPTLYPLMAARRYMYIFAFLIGLAFIGSIHFGNKEKELFATLTVGGK